MPRELVKLLFSRESFRHTNGENRKDTSTDELDHMGFKWLIYSAIVPRPLDSIVGSVFGHIFVLG